ncbi:nucleotide-diphospho-sugar transferase [Ustulina deusta]|nr:nucleotide-diphospho-sugar transferase [Ustulina deusta]
MRFDNLHLLLRRRRTYIFALLVFTLVAVAADWRYFYNVGDWVRQTRPGSYQYEVEKDFVPTDDELDCLYGKTAPIDPHSIEPIPNHAHFIFGLTNPYKRGNAGSFDFLAFLAVQSAIVGLQASRVFLHYTYLADPPSPDPNKDPFSNPWVDRLKNNITLKAAHISDVLRLKILSEQGGIYLDIDAFALRPFTNLLKSPRDIIMGYEGGNRAGLCNAIMVARAGSSFIDRWIAQYNHIDFSKEWNYHSVIFPKELQQQKPDDICTLPPTSFFWPTWTWHHIDWMHESLSQDEARYWTKQIERNGGSLFDHQLAYHAWNQMTWDRYLRHLTPEVVRIHDTRFNLMVRRFLQDDVESVQVLA